MLRQYNWISYKQGVKMSELPSTPCPDNMGDLILEYLDIVSDSCHLAQKLGTCDTNGLALLTSVDS